MADHFRKGNELNADDVCLLISEHSAPYSAVQIANEHDRIMAAALDKIVRVEVQRDAHFAELKRAQSIIDRLALQRELILTSTSNDVIMRRVAKALVESTSGPFMFVSREGQTAALSEARAAINKYLELVHARTVPSELQSPPPSIEQGDAG